MEAGPDLVVPGLASSSASAHPQGAAQMTLALDPRRRHRRPFPGQTGGRTLRPRSLRRLHSARLPSYRCQRMIPLPDLLDDSVRVGGPDEGLGLAVVLGHVQAGDTDAEEKAI